MFKSYRHGLNPMIMAISSVVTLTGKVQFTDSHAGVHQRMFSSNAAIFLKTIHPRFKSSLNITTGAAVYFIRLSCKYSGAAVYGENGIVHIGAKAKVAFHVNIAYIGGAVRLKNGKIIAGAESRVVFVHNYITYDGGAIWLSNGPLILDTNTSLIFSKNHAGGSGGALRLLNGELIINTNAKLSFSGNHAHQGGAIYSETSNNGLSERRTTSVQRTKFMPQIALPIEIVYL